MIRIAAAPYETVISGPRDLPQLRCCLRCGATFASQGVGQRICRQCKSFYVRRNATGPVRMSTRHG